ncbi:hypothetical protein ACWDR9_37265, partial [Streptosporangium sandarakinum]
MPVACSSAVWVPVVPAVRPSAGCPAARWRVGGPPPAAVSRTGLGVVPVRPGDHVIIPNDAYGGTYRL